MKNLAKEIISGRRLKKGEDLSFFLEADSEELFEGANMIRDALCGNKVDLCSIINGRSGRCSENCKFCAQSSHHKTGVNEYEFLDPDIIVEDCKKHQKNGVHRYSIVTSGKTLGDKDFDKAIAAYKKISAECEIELCASQVLKEQYWKRTMGTVRTVLEKIMRLLECYDLKPEMAHKEVGGITNKIDAKGRITHVMEQLEIDWRFSSPIQASDNEIFVKQLIEDQFRYHGLEVLFKAKPIEGVAGNGEHTHLGAAVRLKNNEKVNLFAPNNMQEEYLSEIGYGALMGILKNYEVINPIVSATNDAFNRLKPGFEAPVCTVTSLGGTKDSPSRNRSVLIGVIRSIDNKNTVRFELRSPNPYSNTYLVIAACIQGMLDGIVSVTDAGMDCNLLEKEISKKYGEDAVYLEKFREYRSEKNVFEYYSQDERDKLYGKAPTTVWENINAFASNEIKQLVLKKGDVFTDEIINSFRVSTTEKWKNELEGRIIHDNIMLLKTFVKLHSEHDHATDLDVVNWERIVYLKTKLMKDSMTKKCIFTKIKNAISQGDYDIASDLQIQMNEKMSEIRTLYIGYKNNIF